MYNRLDQMLLARSGRAAPPEGAGLRVALLFVCIAAVVGCIFVRVVWLQSAGRDRFLALWDQTTERLEAIPARDGRILTADGQVLAFDDARHTVAVHYRWLESPPDPDWLTQQARSRLSPTERRDADRLAAAKQQVLEARDRLHIDLAAALGIELVELQRRCQAVQQKVERIVADVEARRAAREAQTTGDAPTPHTETGGWRDAWQSVVTELTTPPRRPQRDPIIVAEELDYHELAGNVPLQTVALINSYPSRFPGVHVAAASERVYPQGALAAHVVGARTPLRPEELTDHENSPGAVDDALVRRVGRTGVELSYDGPLRGQPGVRKLVLNRQGEIVRSDVLRAPIDGEDVTLTLDARLQATAEQLLDAYVERGELPRSSTDEAPPGESASPATGGALVAIDVRTGAILAAASAPRYDARLMVSATQQEWDAVASDPRRPFFPRVTQGTVPPGSVFKLLTSIALLEAGGDPEEPYACRGYFARPDRERCSIYRHFQVGHGPVGLDQALCQSCNCYFFHAAAELGPNAIAEWAFRFGLGAVSGGDLPREKPGSVPTPATASARQEEWYPGTTRQLAIGQAALTTTPLQIARMIAAIANDGWLITPHVLRQVGTPAEPVQRSSGDIQLAGFNLTEERFVAQPVRIDGLSAGTLERVRRGMELVVEHPRGTGRLAGLETVSVAGKTGTAEVGADRPDHAWFAGYAPAEAPRIAFVVMLEHGGSGGRAAAPIAREFVRQCTSLGLTPSRPRLDQPLGRAPAATQ